MTLPIADFLNRLEREGSHPRTVQFYAYPLRKFEQHCRKPLEAITSDDVYAFAKTVVSSDYLRHNYVRAIKLFLKRSGVTIPIKLPKFTAPAPDEYQPEQLKRLFAAADENERRLFMFYLHTGCREGEVMHAVWSNLTDSTYTVRPVGGWSPKKHKTRTVPVSDALMTLLEPIRGEGWIFPNTEGRPNGHHHRTLRFLAKRSGQDPTQFCLQKFRRTFATTMLRANATVHEVAGFLGHSNLDTIQRYLAMANCKSERIRGLANSAFAQM
jgi:integrase/recombinase XerD